MCIFQFKTIYKILDNNGNLKNVELVPFFAISFIIYQFHLLLTTQLRYGNESEV